MRYRQLSTTDLKLSELALGSMTWGTQNSEAEGHAQIERALERGVNIIDTAEMYPTNPLSKETQGDTERVIGSWIAANKARRGDFVLATKVSGSGYKNVRDGAPISRKTIHTALENSLRSLQTDYVDIYQLHWPNRGSYMFRQNWSYDPSGQDRAETLRHMQEVLETIAELVEQGKIRHFGLSNESAWGCARWVRMAEDMGLPRVVSVQNEYSLMCRLFDTDMAEMAHQEQVDLLSFSPLAAGLLTGKYQGDVVPEKSRRSYVNDLGGRMTPRTLPTVAEYLAVAQKHGLNPVQMALAWCRTRPFMGSAIFGATSMEQLDIALGAADVDLSDEVLQDLDAVHKANPMPY
ncbi:aldo/keto reductase [Neptunicoccus sediminis]|uniref:aldo/keto reductase n=1 Tax=Neptunicoccus sediminis TaxID=1892596 RepID=UPI0008460C4C|nr:aldo/keto reductase [Neptunicoccus sediminis]